MLTLPSGDGPKTVYVQYQDNLGSVSSSYSDTIILDTTPPSSVATSPLTSSETSFTVNWSGADGLSGVASYDVQYSVGASGAWITWLAETSATSEIFGPASPVAVQGGEVYYFQVRARDEADNLEAYPGGDGDTQTLVLSVIHLPVVTREY